MNPANRTHHGHAGIDAIDPKQKSGFVDLVVNRDGHIRHPSFQGHAARQGAKLVH